MRNGAHTYRIILCHCTVVSHSINAHFDINPMHSYKITINALESLELSMFRSSQHHDFLSHYAHDNRDTKTDDRRAPCANFCQISQVREWLNHMIHWFSDTDLHHRDHALHGSEKPVWCRSLWQSCKQRLKTCKVMFCLPTVSSLRSSSPA